MLMYHSITVYVIFELLFSLSKYTVVKRQEKKKYLQFPLDFSLSLDAAFHD